MRSKRDNHSNRKASSWTKKADDLLKEMKKKGMPNYAIALKLNRKVTDCMSFLLELYISN